MKFLIFSLVILTAIGDFVAVSENEERENDAANWLEELEDVYKRLEDMIDQNEILTNKTEELEKTVKTLNATKEELHNTLITHVDEKKKLEEVNKILTHNTTQLQNIESALEYERKSLIAIKNQLTAEKDELMNLKSNLSATNADLLNKRKAREEQMQFFENQSKLNQTDLLSQLTRSRKENENLETELRKINQKWQLFCKQKKNLFSENATKTVEKYRCQYDLENNYTVILESACKNNEIDVVTALIVLGLDIDQSIGPNQVTCLHLAANWNHVAMALFLIETGANIEARNSVGKTPLMWTAYKGSLEVAEILVENGAILAAKSHSNRTVLTYAKYYNVKKLVNFLVSKGARQ